MKTSMIAELVPPAPDLAARGPERDEAAALFHATLRLAAVLTRPSNVRRYLNVACEEALALTNSDGAMFCIAEGDAEAVLRVGAAVGSLTEHEHELLPAEGSLAGAAQLTGRPQLSADLSCGPGVYHPHEHPLPAGPALAVPIGGFDEVQGAIVVIRGSNRAPFGLGDAVVLESLARHIGMGFETIQRHERLRGGRSHIERWRRDVRLKRWNDQYDAAAARDRSVFFQWDPHFDRLEWGAGLETVLGAEAVGFGPTLTKWATRFVEHDRHGINSFLREACATQGEVEFCGSLGSVTGAPPLTVRISAWNDPETGLVWGRLKCLESRVELDGHGAVGEADHLPERFLSALRHEINNPLSAVVGLAQLLEREEAIAGKPILRQAAEAIVREGKRVAELLRRLENAHHDMAGIHYDKSGGFALPKVDITSPPAG